ncbi:MAG: hypothetical protein RLZZ511_2953 [Cyanobacteriota bacterium]|jgi:hypothetical protein
MTATIAREVRTIHFIPRNGQRLLSVNLAGLDVGEVWQVAKTMGFTPELIHLRFSATAVQSHALLWEGAITQTPADIDDKLDELWDKFGDAVTYSTGQSKAEYIASGGEIYDEVTLKN